MKIELNKQVHKVETSTIRGFNDLAISLNTELFLTLGEPDFPTPEPIKKACIEALNNNMTKYGPTYGFLSTRKAIIEFEKKFNHVTYTPDQILLTHGSTEAITTAIFTMMNIDDELIVPTPCYPLYRQMVTFIGGKVVTMDTSNNDFQISKEMLESCISEKTKAIILTSPNNPTGTILNDESLRNIAEVIKDKPIYIILDDVYNQIVFTKRPKSLQEYDEIKSQVILCQAFSKPYAMTGWRAGYLIADKDFISQAAKVHQYMIVGLNSFIQPALEVALDYDVSSMIEVYRKRRDYVVSRLREMKLDIVTPEGAFYAFPSIKEFNIPSWEFCRQFAEKYKVALIPGICFEAEGFIRISYCVSQEVIVEALNRLEKFVNELRK